MAARLCSRAQTIGRTAQDHGPACTRAMPMPMDCSTDRTLVPLPDLSSETAGLAPGLSWFGGPFRMIRRISVRASVADEAGPGQRMAAKSGAAAEGDADLVAGRDHGGGVQPARRPGQPLDRAGHRRRGD